MIKHTPLGSQSFHWFIVIRKNVKLPIQQVKQWCITQAEQEAFFLMEHEGDISVETGEVEGVHYHIVLNSAKRHSKSYMLNSIQRFFDFKDQNGIECDIYERFESCVQYLTHQNNTDKTQHDRKEFITNVSEVELNKILDTPVSRELSTQYLVELIKTSKNVIELATKIGLGTYGHYQKVISQFWRIIKNEIV